MLAYLRYALATLCFMLSLSCLALWWRSAAYRDVVYGPQLRSRKVYLESYHGSVIFERLRLVQANNNSRLLDWQFTSAPIREPRNSFDVTREIHGGFGRLGSVIYFPLWYPALLFALSGIAALRLGRRFTLRAAIIATTVVAILLAIPAML